MGILLNNEQIKTNNLLNCSTEISQFTNLSFTDQRIKNQTTHVIIDCDKSNTTNMISSISNNDNTASEIYLTTSNNNTLTVNNQKQALFAYRRKKSKYIYEDKLLHQVKILKQTSHYISNNTIDSNYYYLLQRRIDRLRELIDDENKSIHLTFITSKGVKQNRYSGIVQSEVLLDDLF